MNKIRAFGLVLLLSFGTHIALAEGTNLWRQSRYDEFEKGTAKGVAINSEGRLELAPAFKSIFTSPSTYIWQVVSDAQGTAYLASGSPARVYRVSPDGKASIIFEAKELQVQALEIDNEGSLYAATSPDGKVYKISRGNPKEQGPATSVRADSRSGTSSEAAKSEVPIDKSYESRVFFDPKTKYIWDLALDRSSGRLYIATGDHGEIFKVERDGQGSLFFKSDESHIRCLALQPVVRTTSANDEASSNKRKKPVIASTPPTAYNVIAGTDGSGLIYRITPAGEAFVLYSASKK
jgi:hypothetical protein